MRIKMDSSIENWISSEFSNIELGDVRLVKRFKSIMAGVIKKSESNISSSFASWSEIKSCYRFIANDKFDEKAILSPHRDKTIERIKQEPTVLILQDTTYLEYNRAKTVGLDHINRTAVTRNPIEGLILHNALAVTTYGVPLGLVEQIFVERKSFHGARACRGSEKKKPIKDKESIRWLNILRKSNALEMGKTKTIHIADREGDIYELYQEAKLLNENFIVRVKSNRTINKVKRREPPKEYLFDHLEMKKAQGRLEIDIQVNGKKKFRKANLSIVFSPVSIPPPPNRTVNKDGTNLFNIELFAIMAIERNPPKNIDPIKWVVLTNLSVKTIKKAIQYITWYSYRWNIEIFHKILKSGCGIEKAQLRDGKKLKKYITLKSIVAWRIFWLTRTFERNKDRQCDTVLTKDEWTILYKKFNQNRLPVEPPLIRDVYCWIGQLGGYINRKSDLYPGIISIWKGWTRFMDLIEDYYAFCG
jgi:Transposase DNA-binding/Transposase DDE domain